MEWNEEVIARLRALWAEGLSTAEIGRRLNVSKNAVVGKAHRLNLSPRPSPIRRAAPGASLPEPRPRTGPAMEPTLPSLELPAASPPVPVAPAPMQVAPVQAATMPALVQATPASVVEQVAPGAERASPMRRVPEPSRPALRSVPSSAGGRVSPCCWPIGEPGTKAFHFCDSPSSPGKPYCQTHASIAYVKVRDRREEAA